jgi:protein CWC15
MSTAHRPTWDPAQAREIKGSSRQYSVRDMAAHTKLKFRCGLHQLSVPLFTYNTAIPTHFPRQPGQTSVSEVKKSNLRAELLAAEAEARAKKRKAAGLPVEDEPPVVVAAIEDAEANKRRKVLQEALEMDKDADSDEDEDADADADGPKGGDAKCVAQLRVFSTRACAYVSGYSGEHNKGGKEGDGGDGAGAGRDGEEEEDEDEDDDEEDDTAELFRELEKIKRERAAEKERVEQAEAAVTEAERDARIATANPLLNLAAALGNAPGINTTAPGTFAVKRRWDDGALLVQLFIFGLNERTNERTAGVHTCRPHFQKPGGER